MRSIGQNPYRKRASLQWCRWGLGEPRGMVRLCRVGIRRAVNTSEGEGTRAEQFPDLEGVCHTGEGAFGGLVHPAWRNLFIKRRVKGINTSPHSPPASSPAGVSYRLHHPEGWGREPMMSAVWGNPGCRGKGGEAWRGTGRMPSTPVMFISESFFLFWVSWIFWNTNYLESFKTFHISPNLKDRHLHLGTKHSRNNNMIMMRGWGKESPAEKILGTI